MLPCRVMIFALLVVCLSASSLSAVRLPSPASISSVRGVLQTTISLELTTHTTSSGHKLTTRSLNGTIPGPTFRLKPGDLLVVDFRNNLADQGAPYHHNEFSAPDESNIHYHGLHVSGELPSDDATVIVLPGQTRRYTTQIPASHMPGTHWLHTHRHGSTALQVGGGAASAMIIEDPPGSLPPDVEGARDLLLVLMQIEPDRYARLIQDSGDKAASISGGDGQPFLLVNGEYKPTIEVVPGEWTRVRLVYAAWMPGNLDLAVQGCDMVLLAKDGIYIADFPRPISHAPVPPGGRADFMLRCHEPGAHHDVRGWAGEDEGETITATCAVVKTLAGPAVSSGNLKAWAPAYPAYLFDLRSRPADEGCACVTELQAEKKMNGRLFDPNFFLHESFLGAVVERDIRAGTHQYHQHVFPFQLVTGFEESAYHRAGDWHDTIMGRAMVRYRAVGYEGKVMAHCHDLLHEDKGMMTMELVKPAGSKCVCGDVLRDDPPTLPPWFTPAVVVGEVIGALLLAVAVGVAVVRSRAAANAMTEPDEEGLWIDPDFVRM